MREVLHMLIGLSMMFALSFLVISCDDSDGGGGGGDVEIDADDIGGTVSMSNGSASASSQDGETAQDENDLGGIWVIAETDEVLMNNGAPGKFRKIVVTDENGQFVIPNLPPATYNV